MITFLPLLWVLLKNVTELPWSGTVPHALVWVALIFAIVGTVLLTGAGIRLPGA